MMERIAEASPRFKSRMAGFLYLLIIVVEPCLPRSPSRHPA
jgi:hypothetical protein